MRANVYIYILVMAVVTYLIRVLPLTLIRKKINNVTIRSFLYYVPYATLSVMTFPAIMDATDNPLVGLAALALCIFLALKGAGLFVVSIGACAAVFLLNLFF